MLQGSQRYMGGLIGIWYSICLMQHCYWALSGAEVIRPLYGRTLSQEHVGTI